MLYKAALRYFLAIIFKNRRCFNKMKFGLLGPDSQGVRSGEKSTEQGFRELDQATN